MDHSPRSPHANPCHNSFSPVKDAHGLFHLMRGRRVSGWTWMTFLRALANSAWASLMAANWAKAGSNSPENRLPDRHDLPLRIRQFLDAFLRPNFILIFPCPPAWKRSSGFSMTWISTSRLSVSRAGGSTNRSWSTTWSRSCPWTNTANCGASSCS